jgi:D-3-phosphoglycerate dehydrogenase
MAREGGYRITFSNENIPRVLGGVLSILADHDINVLDMVNKSRGDVAYNIMDIESPPSEEILAAIGLAEGVIRLRVV